MRLDGPKLKVKSARMKTKLRQLAEKAHAHPDRATRDLFQKVIEQVHNRHIAR